MANNLSIRRIRKMSKDDIFAIPIAKTKLTPSVKKRLSDYLSEESDRVFTPEEATIEDFIRSPHSMNQMVARDSVNGTKMFAPSTCEKVIWTLQSVYGIDYAKEHMEHRDEQVRLLPIVHTILTPTTRERLSGFISFASCGWIAPDEANINDLMNSAVDIDDMPAYYEGSTRKMFTPQCCEKIITTLRDDYGIDYRAERTSFLAEHAGLDSFIYRVGLPNGRHLILLKKMGNYNATFRDLLNVPFDYRRLTRFGDDTKKFIQQYFEAEGIDYETSRRK